ncbi:hypothetical protein Glove_71g99 [Diversispora epigaea]|uniref:Uncharacterized protein n=1 Tax=Diversispora epigaea TaxID=1348612 RepID=A0A397JAV0_9GLOM|nr:hypothetical protein Glove_71g99 [Diversispora epigaea]
MVETKKIKTLDWPVILLTLPIENIWKLKVADSILQRIETVLDAKGGQLKFDQEYNQYRQWHKPCHSTHLKMILINGQIAILLRTNVGTASTAIMRRWDTRFTHHHTFKELNKELNKFKDGYYIYEFKNNTKITIQIKVAEEFSINITITNPTNYKTYKNIRKQFILVDLSILSSVT